MTPHVTFFSLALCAGLLSTGLGQGNEATGVEMTLSLENGPRTYRIQVPKKAEESGEKMPVVFCLHGGGSNASILSKSGWSATAEEHSFIVVYPEGLNGHWNDGRGVRKFAAQNAKTDDVAFLIQLLDELIKQHPIDPERVYLVGLSNGGFMVQRLANEHTTRFAAAAVHIASLPTTYLEGPLSFSPRAPLSVLFMNGTKDPFMPYQGGKLTPNLTPHLVDSASFDFGQGQAIPTIEAAHLWVKHNQLDPKAETVTELPDAAPNDGCRVTLHHWKGPDRSVEVRLYTVHGGGHTLPGGAQYLPERIIGPVCHDLDGIQTTWEFLQSKRR